MYGQPLETVTSFKYLGRLLTATDKNWIEFVVNIYKAQSSWSCMSRMLGREGADPRISGRCYLVVFQVVLLFGEETWVVNLRTGRLLGSFRHRVARSLEMMRPWRRTYGRWI